MQIPSTHCGGTEFRWGERTYIMGIINTSPDSFSGDGLTDLDSVSAQAKRFVEEGADILDVGGETTKPGSKAVSLEEEIRRVVPAIERLASEVSVPISVDSYKSAVVEPALKAGASIINDQWGLKKDTRLAGLAVEYDAPLIMMSNQRDRGRYDPGLKRDVSFYDDAMAEMMASMKHSIALALELGVPEENIIVDPGIGFGKTWQQELEIIRRLGEMKELGRPVLLGTSRKSFIAKILDEPTEGRLEGTAASVVIGISQGADIVRVHDVKEMVRVCRVADAILRPKAS